MYYLTVTITGPPSFKLATKPGTLIMFNTKDLLNAIVDSGNTKMQKEFWRARLLDPDQSFFDEFSQPPQVLYKYIPECRLDDVLPDRKPCTFRATPPNELNDINEINYIPTFKDDEDNREQINLQYALALTELHPESPIHVKEVEQYRQKYPIVYGEELTCDQLSRRYGITSFTTINNDVKMWSSYADDCKGVVVGFNVDYWVGHLFDTSIIRQVQYMNKLPFVLGPRSVNQENAHLFMSTKGEVWKYEKEWRLITEMSDTIRSGTGIETITVPQASVSSIYVTDRTSKDSLDIISRRLSNPSNDYRVRVINKLQKGREYSTLAHAGQIKLLNS